MKGIRDLIKDNIVLFDGAMGTMLQKKGLKLGENPEVFGIENPEKLIDIHREYISSGSDIITTNTFGANELKLSKSAYSVEEVIDKSINIAKEARADKNVYIAQDIGPIGEMLEPMGTLSFDKAYEIFKRQVIQGQNSGADLIIIETMMDLYELKAAVLAVKENCNLPVFCTMTFDESGRSFTGCTPESMVAVLEGLGVDALGVNCSLGPKQLLPIVKSIVANSNLPIIVQANAGLPKSINGKTVYDLSPDEYFEGVKLFVENGASIIGGCCGTNPDFIKMISQEKNLLKKIERKYVSKCIVCTPSKHINIDNIKVVGERINPTGKKLLQEALSTENMDYIMRLAIEQVDAGTDILNINVGIPKIDEKSLIRKVIKNVQEIIDTPLQIDSSNVNALEEGLRYYNGKSILNSVNGEEESLNRILPIAKKYGSAIIGLTIDEDGIPQNADGRLKVAEKIVNRALELGIKKEDIFIDCLALTVSAQQDEAIETLKAVKLVKEKLGVKTILGVSNISFGLPNRKAINHTFLSLALGNGLDLAIINPNDESMMEVINSYRVLNGYDIGCISYIEKYSNKDIIKSNDNKSNIKDLEYIVLKGLKDEIKECIIKLLEKHDENYILDNMLIPSLDKVGNKYESGDLFLPQLIQSADTVKIGILELKESLSKKSNRKISKGKIIVATVKGDIHDIGKNIVKVMLENYGYDVIDLGKDVDIEEVVLKAKEHDVKLVGLSALMTTTVKSMEDTIKALRENGIDATVFVGGAVLTEEYSKNIGADFYAKDAKESVEIAKNILK
ncbi:MAG: homocysteine S-methyltransferase family protein [Paraclostridium sp.]